MLNLADRLQSRYYKRSKNKGSHAYRIKKKKRQCLMKEISIDRNSEIKTMEILKIKSTITKMKIY